MLTLRDFPGLSDTGGSLCDFSVNLNLSELKGAFPVDAAVKSKQLEHEGFGVSSHKDEVLAI